MRNNLKPLLLLIFLLLFSLLIFPQTNKYRWAFDCSYEGTFDTLLFTETQLRDVYTLCFTNISSIRCNAIAWQPEGIDKLSIDSLDKEYKYKLEQIENLEIPNNPYWKRMKIEQINYLNAFYKMARTSILSYKNPLILKQYNSSDSCEYADAIIEGGEKIFATWEKLAKLQCRNNGNPEKCFKDIFSDKFNSSENKIYAQIEIMLWGWWNICGIRNLPKLEDGIEVHKEFKKLFTEIKNLGCDEGG